MSIKFERNISFPGKIVLLDGISGTGKTMIHRILDSYICNHPPKFSYTIEQICTSYYCNKLEKDAAISLLKLQSDQIKYDMQIGREINLRKNDLSSIFKSVKKFSYLKKLIEDDGEFAVTEIQNHPKNIVLITHQLLGATQLFEDTFSDEFINLHAVRHPVYLFSHWSTYVPLLGSSVRDLTIWKNEDGVILPWFFTNSALHGNYKTLEDGDKTLVCLIELVDGMVNHHVRSKNKQNYLAIEFEKFVLDPFEIITKIDKIIGSSQKTSINKILGEEKIPRSHINSGKSLSIYKRYGSNSYKSNLNHKDDYLAKLDFIKSQTSKLYFDRFKNSVSKYENLFDLWF
jgi:hypothetical protein